MVGYQGKVFYNQELADYHIISNLSKEGKIVAILKQLGWFFRQQWRQYFGGVIALILVAICNVIPARIIGNVVDAISAHRVVFGWLMLQLGIMVSAALIQYFLRFAWQKLLYGSSYVLERQLRSQLFHHFMVMDPSFYQRWRTGDLMAHATNDVEAVREVASYGILTLADSVTTTWAIRFMMPMVRLSRLLGALTIRLRRVSVESRSSSRLGRNRRTWRTFTTMFNELSIRTCGPTFGMPCSVRPPH